MCDKFDCLKSDKFDFIKMLKEYVEKIVNSFLKKYGLTDEDYNRLISEANKCDSIIGYFNTLTNGAVDEVVKNKRLPITDIREDFTRTYMGGIKGNA